MMDNSPKDILIVVAHPSEADSVRKAIPVAGSGCELLVTGVGGAAMSWALQKRFSEGPLPLLTINAGIAGSYIGSLKPGDIVIPVSDCFADMGVDDNGSFVSIFRANLANPDEPPFTGGRIVCSNRWTDTACTLYPAATAATVNMTSGSLPVIDRIRREWNPDIETMEGAWFAYTCALHKAGYMSVRAVSNIVEPRDLKRWNIPLALSKLETAVAGILNTLRSL
jgi:futalosine hydrolase